MPDVTFATASAGAPSGPAATPAGPAVDSRAPATDRLVPGSTADRASNAHMPYPLFLYVSYGRSVPTPCPFGVPTPEKLVFTPPEGDRKDAPRPASGCRAGRKIFNCRRCPVQVVRTIDRLTLFTQILQTIPSEPRGFTASPAAHRNSAATSSAICAVFRAAPLRRLSPHTKSSSAVGSSSARRTRPTQVGSVPTTSDGVGNSPASGLS